MPDVRRQNDQIKIGRGLPARSMLALGAAILLPSLIYLLLQVGVGYRTERRTVEAATLARAERISADVDTRLQSVSALIRALATIRSIDEHNWREAYARARDFAALDSGWRSVALDDLAEGTEVFDLRRPFGAARPIDPAATRRLVGLSRDRVYFSGMERSSTGVPEVIASYVVRRNGADAYLLRIALDPDMVQRILLNRAPREGVSAVVDRHGLFIGRTLAYAKRVGTPGTHFLRDAIAHGATGFYEGRTWEGFPNYTAFVTSPRTGWSSHVAVSSAAIDGPQRRWQLATLFAAIVSVALAAIFAMLSLRLLIAQRKSDARLQEAQRLEAVGKLTGGVAHDFNNMLAIVIGSLDLAQRRIAAGKPDVLRLIENAMEGAHRAADLTRRLLAFSRRQSLAPAPIDVNALMSGMQALLHRTLGETIIVETHLAPDLWTAFADPGLLENAVVNLAINARDAMPDGGTVTITTSNVRVGPDELPSLAGGPPADHVQIAVSDTGEGMTADVMARAFEPFFTTKEVGRGTGLGLSQIHGFVTQSGGVVSIQSKPGKGTTVTMTLPRYEAESDVTDTQVVTPDHPIPMGDAREIILVVEDEERVRRMTVEALRNLGYTVHEAADANIALRQLDAATFDLLLTDIVMPGVGGRQLAEIAIAKYPAIAVLFVTGFERDDVDTAPGDVLHKPFTVGELAHRVRESLDARAE
jgi:signal transduction histidine kinase/CheY-like chemotaxis protein